MGTKATTAKRKPQTMELEVIERRIYNVPAILQTSVREALGTEDLEELISTLEYREGADQVETLSATIVGETPTNGQTLGPLGAHTGHPGELLWAEWLDPLETTVGKAAKAIGTSRKTLSAIINGRQAITPEMSVRLGLALGVPADAWLKKQMEYDLTQVNRRTIRVKRLTPDGIELDVE